MLRLFVENPHERWVRNWRSVFWVTSILPGIFLILLIIFWLSRGFLSGLEGLTIPSGMFMVVVVVVLTGCRSIIGIIIQEEGIEIITPLGVRSAVWEEVKVGYYIVRIDIRVGGEFAPYTALLISRSDRELAKSVRECARQARV